jgi:hypothetical protein
MSPWERRLAKNIMPFYGWYKFVSKFAAQLPMTYPGRAMMLDKLGQLGASAQDQLGPIPEWLRASIIFDTHNLQSIHYLSMLGLNPLGDTINPAGGFNGIMRLGQLSPIIQATMAAWGINTLTGQPETIDPTSGIIEVNGQYVNVHTGQVAGTIGQAGPLAGIARFIGGLARGFPELRIAETAYTGGHPLYPESIPLVAERPMPLAPGTKPQNVSPTSIGLQFLGVDPKTYNLQHYQQSTLRDIMRARTTYFNDLAKQRAQGILPKVPAK